MMFKWIIHSKYDGFLADVDTVAFTSNVPKTKKFNSQGEAINYARKLLNDNKIDGDCDIIAYPSEGNKVKK